MQIVWAVFGLVLAISISIPFVNQYLLDSLNLNLSFVYVLSSSLAIFIFALQSKNVINKMSFLIFCCLIITFSMNIGSGLTNGFISILIGFVLCMPFLQNNLPPIFLKSLVTSLLLFSCFFFSLVTTDSRLFDLIYLQTRMAMGNSPISIAIIAAISVLICAYYIKNVNYFQRIVLFIMTMFFISAILFSGSRGPLLALFIIFLLQLARNGKFLLISLMSILGGFCALFILSIRDNYGDSSSSRLVLYQEAFNIASDAPLGGFQIGKYSHLTGKPFPHNFFLELWIDLNIFFLLIIISLTLYVVYQRYVSLYKTMSVRENLIIDIYMLIFICCQFSLPSTEMLRVLLPLLFISLCSISLSRNKSNKGEKI